MIAKSPLVMERPRFIATDERLDALFAARAALKRAFALRATADLQIDQLRALVVHLEAARIESEQRG